MSSWDLCSKRNFGYERAIVVARPKLRFILNLLKRPASQLMHRKATSEAGRHLGPFVVAEIGMGRAGGEHESGPARQWNEPSPARRSVLISGSKSNVFQKIKAEGGAAGRLCHTVF